MDGMQTSEQLLADNVANDLIPHKVILVRFVVTVSFFCIWGL